MKTKMQFFSKTPIHAMIMYQLPNLYFVVLSNNMVPIIILNLTEMVFCKHSKISNYSLGDNNVLYIYHTCIDILYNADLFKRKLERDGSFNFMLFQNAW